MEQSYTFDRISKVCDILSFLDNNNYRILWKNVGVIIYDIYWCKMAVEEYIITSCSTYHESKKNHGVKNISLLLK